jgi:type IV pilus assembly protein PilW
VPAYDAQPQPEEIVEGVEGLALLFGEDLDGQRAANRYVTADAVGNWSNVVSLRAQVLLGTARDSVATSPQPYSFAGVSTTPADRRIRSTMASVITVRNRVP